MANQPVKVYRGVRDAHGCTVTVKAGSHVEEPLPMRHDLRTHSDHGFEWGYFGDGPKQLALALCADVLGDDVRALRVYKKLKSRILGHLQGDEWTMTAGQLWEAIEALERA